MLLRLHRHQLAVLVYVIQKVAGGHLELFLELLGGIDAGINALRPAVVENRDELLLGAQVLSDRPAEIELVAGRERDLHSVGKLADQLFVPGHMPDFAKLRFGDDGNAPFITAFVDREPIDAVSLESPELFFRRLAQIHALVEAECAGAVRLQNDEGEVVRRMETSLRQHFAAGWFRLGETDLAVVDYRPVDRGRSGPLPGGLFGKVAH